MTQALSSPSLPPALPPIQRCCANCSTPLQGEFCHVCGQSVHSVLKPVHGMLDDTLDLLLNIDGRVIHTLPPLLLRPGFLTLEYFAGRRMRYLAPFRLMFALCLLAFFLLPLALDTGSVSFEPTVKVQGSDFQQASTPAEVDRLLQKKLAQFAPTSNIPVVGKLAGHEMDQARLVLVRRAMQRRIELGDKTAVIPDSVADIPKAPVDPQPPTERQQRNPFNQHWDMQKYPVKSRWLPDFLNLRLNRALQRMNNNLAAVSGDGEQAQAARERVLGQLFSALPGTMFFMLPAFALLLKVVYLFRRRLYMEHLIVALHSHAFLFLSLLLGTLLQLLSTWLTPHAAWLATPISWLIIALWTWAPIYLLIMQKRIYRQGWPMTILKYLFVGWCYIFLLTMALLGAAALSLTE
ncbi:MAG TPA: DUF3667 domain-containing protein [Rhodanobacter sp.]|nr:DUF3667 domain-containing protein [Rhodanobacter sp.]